MTIPEEPAAIILCGGKTTRFGGDKARALVGGRPVIERVLEAIGPLTSRVIVVTSAEQPDLRLPGEVEPVADAYPGRGPLGGIATGLAYTRADLALVVGCDMPFLNGALLHFLLGLAGGFDAVVPRQGNGRPEPLHAVYAHRCLPRMEAQLAAGRLAVWKVLADLNTRYVEEAEYGPLDPAGLSFFNLNSPADLPRASRIAADLPASSQSSR